MAAPLRSAVRRVRPMHPHVQQLLHIGTAQSFTFARLLEAIEQSNVIVYVDVDVGTSRAAARSGALFFVGAAGGDRLLRIQLYANTTSWLLTLERARRLVTTLAHELQHVREVAAAKWVRDEASFLALFRNTGFRTEASHRHQGYDTYAARDVSERVRDELHGLGRPVSDIPGPESMASCGTRLPDDGRPMRSDR